MKPVMQTTFGNYGNCFQACLASVLEIPLDSIPEFRRMQVDQEVSCMVSEADKWLRSSKGLRFISVEMYNSDGGDPNTTQCLLNRLAYENRDEFVLLSGKSPRKKPDGSDMYHCVVGVAECWGFNVVHDPHHDGGGIIGHPFGVKWIVPIR